MRNLRSSALSAIITCCGLLFSAYCHPAQAGEFNSTINIGDKVSGWSELPGTDDQRHSLKDLKQDVVVVVFTCNSCPYAIDYEDRINALAKRYADPNSKVAVVAINANKVEADLLPAMKKRAAERKFHFPYLFDESQQVPKNFGAVRTPEFFVLNKDRHVVYMGAMDDNTKADQVKIHYVDLAIEATLAGKPIEKQETAPVGCGIRFARDRKKP